MTIHAAKNENSKRKSAVFRVRMIVLANFMQNTLLTAVTRTKEVLASEISVKTLKSINVALLTR